MGPLLALFAASTAMNAVGNIAAGSAERRSFDDKASAMRALSQKRQERARAEAANVITQGGLDQTTFASRYLSAGVGDRESLAQDISLIEIMNRAKLEASQILADSEYEANLAEQDAQTLSRQGREAQKIGALKTAGSILSLGISGMEAKYGKDAWSKGWGEIF